MSHRTVFVVAVLCVIVITSLVKALDTDKERLQRLLEKIDNTNLTKADFVKSGRTLDASSGLSNMNGTVATSNESRKSDLKKTSTLGGADLLSPGDGKNESSLFAVESSISSDEEDIADIKEELQVLLEKISAFDSLTPSADENKKQNAVTDDDSIDEGDKDYLSPLAGEDSRGNNGISIGGGDPMRGNSKYNGTTVDDEDSKDIVGKNEDETKLEGNKDVAAKDEDGYKLEENKDTAWKNENETKLEGNEDVAEKDEDGNKLEENKDTVGKNEDETKLEGNEDVAEEDEDGNKLEENKDIAGEDEDENKLEGDKDIPEKDEDVNKLEEHKDKAGEDEETIIPHAETNTAPSTDKSSSRKSTLPLPEADPVPIKKMAISPTPRLLPSAMVLVALFAVTYVVYKRRHRMYIWIYEKNHADTEKKRLHQQLQV